MKILEDTAYIPPEYLSEDIDSATDLFVFPTSLLQQRLWLQDRLTGTTANYNIPSVFRQGNLFDLELLYDFRAGLFIDVFGVKDSLKQLTISQLMHYVNPASAKKL